MRKTGTTKSSTSRLTSKSIDTMRYFTADWHLNSNNIIEYAKRPYKDARDALFQLMKTCNLRMKMTCQDTLIHVGDFILIGSDRHDKRLGGDEKTDLQVSAKAAIAGVFANLVLLSGNHDDGHNVETAGKSMVLDLNQTWRNVTVSHYPSYAKEYRGFKGTVQKPHVHLCGHVHDKWLVCWDEKNHVMNVNVGIDVWNYKPVRDAEITEMLDYIWNGKVRAPDQMDRVQFEEWKRENERFVAADCQRRKSEKHAKKGLTPEECQRRKEAAMRAKGLIK